jgi:hypothetical protein
VAALPTGPSDGSSAWEDGVAVRKTSDAFERFVKADQPVKQRLIWASYGEVGTLKTSFGLSAPGPIVVFSFDKGLEGVIEPFQSQKDIYVSEYDWHPTDNTSQDEAIELRDRYIEDWEHAITVARTVLVDKETQVWELFRYAEFGAPNDAPKNYPALYQRYRRLINITKELDLNVGFIQSMRAIWGSKTHRVTGKEQLMKTDVRERRGFDELEELVHINIEHALVDGEFVMNVGKSRGPGGRNIQNTRLPAMTFPEFATLVFPDTGEGDWV